MSVVCPEDITYIEVSSHLAINIACFVHSNTFLSKLHQKFTINLTSNVLSLDLLVNLNFFSITYVINSLSELTFF